MEGPADLPLLASGRAADVFDLAPDRVLRRYRTDRSCEPEARMMTWLRDQGIAVPAVHEATGRDLIMEKLIGPTMLEHLQQRPWHLLGCARILAELQERFNSLRAPEWLPALDGIPPGNNVLHLDLHPMNVMLTPTGPVVIDWTNASRGPGSFDAAYSWVLMKTFETENIVDRIGQQILTRAFRQHRNRRELDSHVATACAWRLADPGTTPGERVKVEKLRASA